MGMFDTVFFECPNCGKTLSDQSKSGECQLKEYSISKAPLEALSDIVYRSQKEPYECDFCKALIDFEYTLFIKPVLKNKKEN